MFGRIEDESGSACDDTGDSASEYKAESTRQSKSAIRDKSEHKTAFTNESEGEDEYADKSESKRREVARLVSNFGMPQRFPSTSYYIHMPLSARCHALTPLTN